MAYCLWCNERIKKPVSWHEVFGMTVPSVICEVCRSKLQELKAPICRICGRSLTDLDKTYKKDGLCYDCIRWENSEWRGLLRKNRSLYTYNTSLKELLALYKFRGDAVIVQGFAVEWRKLYEREFMGLPVIPIPLSPERLYERGFNQSEELAKLLPIQRYNQLVRTIHETKQSKKSRQQRLEVDWAKPIFQSRGFPDELMGREIVLIDDIYTTGTTLRRAAKVLMDNGAGSVSSLTLARG